VLGRTDTAHDSHIAKTNVLRVSRVRYVACGQGGVSTPADRKHGCHWDYVCGPNRGGAAPRTMVWICEYPYRTVRLDGPCDDCKCLEPGETTGTTGTTESEVLVRRSSKSEGGRLLPFRDNR